MSDLPKVAPLLWVLWHHLGANSTVGQPIREYLGIGRSDLLTDGQTKVAQEYGIRRASGNGDQILEAPAYARVACHDEELLRRLERLEAQLAMHAKVFDLVLQQVDAMRHPTREPAKPAAASARGTLAERVQRKMLKNLGKSWDHTGAEILREVADWIEPRSGVIAAELRMEAGR
jgi:hypothetical protein